MPPMATKAKAEPKEPKPAKTPKEKPVKEPKPAKVPKAKKSGPIIDTSGRQVVYPELAEMRMTANSPDGPLTVEVAKQLMGWEEESGDKKFGSDSFIKDRRGVKVRAGNNIRNRPFYVSDCERLMQIVLHRRYLYNGEPIIVSKTGYVYNGQHQMTALILAEQERTGPNAEKWATYWDGPCYLDKLVVVGVDEDDDTVNSMDTCKLRSLLDVFYRSEHLQHLTAAKRKQAAGMIGFAVRLLWERTGAKENPHTPYFNHDEATGFIQRHPTLLKCVSWIMDEDETPDKLMDGTTPPRPLSRYITPGYLSAMMYLMTVSGTKPGTVDYITGNPSEESLDVERFDKACEFLILLKTTSGEDGGHLKSLRAAIATAKSFETGMGGTRDELCGLLALAWDLWVTNDGKLPRSIGLKYLKNPDDGSKSLKENPTLGGIDIGPKGGREQAEGLPGLLSDFKSVPAVAAESSEGEDADPFDPSDPSDENENPLESGGGTEEEYVPTPEEIEAEKERIKAENRTKK